MEENQRGEREGEKVTIVLGRRGADRTRSRWEIVRLIAVVSEARLTLTELPVLGDHLAVAGAAVAGVGAVAVDAAAFALARVVLALVHIYTADGEREREKERQGAVTKVWRRKEQ